MVDDATEELNAGVARLIFETLRADVRSDWFSPFGSEKGLGGLPRTYVQVGGRDVWRENGVVFARALEVGVEVRLDGFEGLTPESWTVLWGEKEDEEGLKRGWMGGMRWLMRREEGGIGFAGCGSLGVELGSLLGVGSFCVDSVPSLDVECKIEHADQRQDERKESQQLGHSRSRKQQHQCIVETKFSIA